MNILITGSGGFIGRNLCAHLRNSGYTELYEYKRDTPPDLLEAYTEKCDFVFHLAGVNRPDDPLKFSENHEFTKTLLQCLDRHGNKAPVLMTSSAQAAVDNPYGVSKRKAEDLLFLHSYEARAEAYIYRLPGIFGKWCRPNYNSVVATFCDAVARDQPVAVHDPDRELTLAHIDDVMAEFLNALQGNAHRQGMYCLVDKTYRIKVGELKNLIRSFREGRETLSVPDMSDPFTSKLYSTYLSYLPEDAFSYPLTVHNDHRGSFTEFLKSESGGQIAVNISKPGVSKGNHWHHTKTEKILVVSGTGSILFRRLFDEKVLVYQVSGDIPTVVDVPAGYVHSVINTGASDLVMVIWANQLYDPEKPDTYREEIAE
jgi:UDP-2-acetamido-2,6-beta-L-arabino-hexul-4-ose reductase